MSKKKLADAIRVETPCAEDWDKMRGDKNVRFCDHCNLNVNNISMLTRKKALKLVRESNGRLCVRYVVNPVNNQPVFADKFYQIGRRAPRIAAATIAATLGLSAMTYAQGGVAFGEILKNSDAAQTAKSEKETPNGAAATVSGTISDQTGAVIPNITVTLLNIETNQSRSAASNDEGFYEFQNISNGKYTLKADGNNGFKTTQIENLIVNDGANLKNDISMEVSGEIVMVGVIGISEYENPLHRAVSKNDAEEVKNLIINGAPVNSKDENYDNITPLFVAVENGSVEITEILLNFGAKPNARDETRQTPLMRLDADASAELVNLLIRHGAKVNAVDEEKTTPIIFAARNAKPEILKILIENGANINRQNEAGETALMIAAENDNLENVRFLLDAGANLNLKDAEGDTAIEYANEEETEKLLISFGAKTEVTEPNEIKPKN